jgi:hypothetical protein
MHWWSHFFQKNQPWGWKKQDKAKGNCKVAAKTSNPHVWIWRDIN